MEKLKRGSTDITADLVLMLGYSPTAMNGVQG
jgi:hypothetical protein